MVQPSQVRREVRTVKPDSGCRVRFNERAEHMVVALGRNSAASELHECGLRPGFGELALVEGDGEIPDHVLHHERLACGRLKGRHRDQDASAAPRQGAVTSTPGFLKCRSPLRDEIRPDIQTIRRPE